jgi:aminopeptidase N
MKARFYVAGLVLLLSSIASAQRLPHLATPENYKLTFAPDFSKANFAGDETIRIRVLQPTSELVLNSAALDFNAATISSGNQSQQAKVTFEKEKEMATLHLDKPLQPGPATIQIHYTGILNSELRGFYLGKDENGNKYGVTQFEATDARRAFPSFDEPEYKATFDVTMIADRSDIAISNSKQISDTPGPAQGKHTIRFATTPRMSSYLVAVAVGKFEYAEGSADGVPIRVYTTPGKTHLAGFALRAAEESVRYFDRYFGIPYPFGKLDNIALPDFAAGAMENTGLITYREVEMLIDENHASIDQQKRVGIVIAHEIAHQWFGDLVTMSWWDDVWLNEGFASWMETRPIAAWKPEWHLELDDVEDTSGALNTDSLANTRPIRQDAETPDQITELFDGIVYAKAAAVIRMLESYLGADAFRAGVNKYLKDHSYGNATSDDFFRTLAEVSKKPVDRIMAGFVTQPGAPLVRVQAQCSGKTTEVTLSQTRYFYDVDLFEAGTNESWLIPVCMRLSTEDANSGHEQCELLSKKQESFTLPQCAPWVLANTGAKGYFRSAYEPQVIRTISAGLESKLIAAERIRLLGDEWALVRVGQHRIGDYLALAAGLQADRNSAVMKEVTEQLLYISDYLVTDSASGAYQEWVRRLFTPAARELGWQPSAGENDDRKTLRAYVLDALGYSGRDPQTLADVTRLALLALENPSAVDASIAGTVFHLAAINGDASLYEKMLAGMRRASSPEERAVLMRALSEFRDPKLLERTLQLALTPEIRSQDMAFLISAVVENPAGRRIGWDFMRTHWAEIEKILGGFNTGDLVGSTSAFCDSGMRDEVKNFFATHKPPAQERTLKQSLERISYCVNVRSLQADDLATWLQGHSAPGGN